MTTPKVKQPPVSAAFVFDNLLLRNDIIRHCVTHECTREEFYQRVHLSSALHSKLLHNKRTPSALSLLLICQELGRDPMRYLVPAARKLPAGQALVTAWVAADQRPALSEQD